VRVSAISGWKARPVQLTTTEVQRWTLFTANCKTEELRTLEQRLTELRESIAAANRRS
jgi:hypothetical protein